MTIVYILGWLYFMQIVIIGLILFLQSSYPKDIWMITTKKQIINNLIPFYYVVHIKKYWENFND